MKKSLSATKLKLKQNPNKKKLPIASIDMVSPFLNSSVAFQFKSTDFPSMHTHNHWEIFFIASGTILHTLNGEERILTKGEGCLIQPSDKHNFVFINNQENNYCHVNITFSNEVATQLIFPHTSADKLQNFFSFPYFYLTHDTLRLYYDKLLFTQNLPQDEYETNSKLILNQLLLFFLEQRLLHNKSYPHWLNQFLEYISTPSNFEKSVEELAKFTPYSYSRLTRIFKMHLNMSIVEYIQNAKLNYAKRLLRTTDLTTLEISSTISYDSLSTFNHLFKKTYNCTPSQYRKTHKT